jgi:uncharacterized damage-inducible protein DinB
MARLSVGGAEFWVSDESPDHGNSGPASESGASVRMILTVADPDAAFVQAIKAGATEVYPVSEGHGWRVGRLVDPFGHHWEIGREVGDEEPVNEKTLNPAETKDDLHSTSNQGKTATLFLNFSRQKLMEQYWVRLWASVEPLTDEQIWWRPNTASNSIGNLILHLNGNVRQWLVDSFNRTNDERNRPAEFSAEGGLSAAQLIEKLGATMQEADRVLVRLTESELTAPYEIQGYHVTGLDAVYQVVEHFGLHYGQIAYIAKSLSGRDLGFYRELSETGRAG